jgi:hypothetical protein
MEDHVTSKPGRPRKVEQGRTRGVRAWKISWWKIKEDIVRQSTEDLVVAEHGRSRGGRAWKIS